MVDVIMPKMGDAMTEGKILKWHKRPGDAVAKGEAIAEIETDKVNVDIEAEDGGTLLEIAVGEGQSAPVGGKIAVIGNPEEKTRPAGRAEAKADAAPAATKDTPPARQPAPQAAQPRIPATAPEAATPARPSGDRRPVQPAAGRVKASPLARRLADEHGIDLAQITGSGPEGRITKEDVEALIASAPTAAPARPPVTAADYEDVALTRMRQTIARRMTESKQQAPHFYVTVEVMMDEALRARQQLNAAVGEQRKVSVNDFVIKASAMALRHFPNINSVLLDGKIRRYRRINVAIAIALPEGLIAPVVRDCDHLTLVQIATEARALAERARSGHLRPEDYEGGTFTISNLGMFDVENFIAIINPPHAAILAVGSAQPRPAVRSGQIGVASVMKLTLSADHRVTDGAEVATFLSEVKRLLENPLLLFLNETAG